MKIVEKRTNKPSQFRKGYEISCIVKLVPAFVDFLVLLLLPICHYVIVAVFVILVILYGWYGLIYQPKTLLKKNHSIIEKCEASPRSPHFLSSLSCIFFHFLTCQTTSEGENSEDEGLNLLIS